MLWLGYVYLAAMVLLTVVRMVLLPETSWPGEFIRIAPHFALAAFVILFGLHHRSERMSAATYARPGWMRRTSFAGAFLILFLVAAAGIAYTSSTDWLAWRLGARPAEFAVRAESGVTMETADGVPLVARIFHPVTEEPVPTLLVRIPYAKTLRNTLFTGIVGRFWAERGYHVVIQATRGRYDSGGDYYPMRHERADGIDTLSWLADQPWFDGRLGMWGGSYFGYTQWVLADRIDPGPMALMIQLASTDMHAMLYPGGAFSLQSALTWALWTAERRDIEPPPEAFERGYGGFPLVEADDRAGQGIVFFDDWVNHPNRDAYWIDIDGEKRAARSEAPVLLMAGWYDPFLPRQLDDFVALRRDGRPNVAEASRLIIGPWAHAFSVAFPDGITPENYRFESLAPTMAWFDRHLRHMQASQPDTAPVRLYVMGEHVWRDEQEWPLARTRYTSYFLHSGGNANSGDGDGSLSTQPPSHDEQPDRFLYDPLDPAPSAGGATIGPKAGIALQNAIEARPDVLVYSTPVLESDLEVTGPLTLILYVATSATNTDFVGKLVDVHPDGSAFNVSDGILRTRFQPGDEHSSPTRIEIELWPTSMLFRKGHRLRLEVSSSSFPRYDRNPNTGAPIATERRPVTAAQAVFHDPTATSHLRLPIIPRN